MPRRITPEQAELHAKLAQVKALKAAQTDAERPLRRARAKLAQRVSGFQSTLTRATERLSKALHKEGYHGMRFMSQTPEHQMQDARRRFDSALVDLQTFDALHAVEGATYPTASTIDRDAIAAQGRAEREAELARFRPAKPRVDDKPPLPKSYSEMLTMGIAYEFKKLGLTEN